MNCDVRAQTNQWCFLAHDFSKLVGRSLPLANAAVPGLGAVAAYGAAHRGLRRPPPRQRACVNKLRGHHPALYYNSVK